MLGGLIGFAFELIWQLIKLAFGVTLSACYLLFCTWGGWLFLIFCFVIRPFFDTEPSNSGSGGGSYSSYPIYTEAFVDASGVYRRPGEAFVDASGVYRQPGEPYVDYSGKYRMPGEAFVDASGTYRQVGEPYIDYSGKYRH